MCLTVVREFVYMYEALDLFLAKHKPDVVHIHVFPAVGRYKWEDQKFKIIIYLGSLWPA